MCTFVQAVALVGRDTGAPILLLFALSEWLAAIWISLARRGETTVAT